MFRQERPRTGEAQGGLPPHVAAPVGRIVLDVDRLPPDSPRKSRGSRPGPQKKARVRLRIVLKEQHPPPQAADDGVALQPAGPEPLPAKRREEEAAGRRRARQDQLTSWSGWRSGRQVVHGRSPTASARFREPKYVSSPE